MIRLFQRRQNLSLALLIFCLLAVRLALYASVTSGWAALPEQLCHYDCQWYVRMAATGYDLQPLSAPPSMYGQANWAFMPVFPLLIRIVAMVFHFPLKLAGLAIANVALAAFAFAAAKYLALVRQARSSAALCVFIFVFPYGFYDSLAYTESLFSALTMLAFYLMARRQDVAACAVTAVLSATRVTGVLLALILMARLLAPAAAAAWRGEWRVAFRRGLDVALPVAVAPLGLFIFMGYLYFRVGDGLAFQHIQTSWARDVGFPLVTLWQGLRAPDFQDIISATRQSGGFAAICALAGIALAIRLWRMRRYAEACFLLASILLPLSAGLTSLYRYVLANPIFEVYLFDVIARGERYTRWLAVPVLLACVMLQLYFVHLWTENYASLF